MYVYYIYISAKNMVMNFFANTFTNTLCIPR